MAKKIILILTTGLLLVRLSFSQITASITIDRNDSTYCLNDTVFFTNSSTGDYVTSHWFFGDNTDTWTQNPFHVYQNTGKFTVTLIITDTNANSDTATIQITVNPRPGLTLINNTAGQYLTARVTDTSSVFKWYFNSELSSNTDSILYYYESGLYSVSAINKYGCKDSAWINISLNTSSTTANDTLTISVANNILTPNNDGANDVLFINDLTGYNAPCQVLIYNSNGILVYRNDDYSNVSGFEGRDNRGKLLPAGTYYYIIRSQGRKTATGFIDLIR